MNSGDQIRMSSAAMQLAHRAPRTDFTNKNPSPCGITFIGDVMLGRGVGTSTSPDRLVEALRQLRGERDLIANLECCITDADQPAAHAHSAFSGSRELLRCLPAAGVRAANVANNHALDFGARGLNDTVEALDGLGICVLGMRRPGMPIEPFRTHLASSEVAVFGCCALTLPAEFWRAGVLRATDPDLIEAIRALAQTETVVVYVHWGHEMITVPPPESRKLARRYADLGVRFVVGHGPHVVHGHELVGDCDVFYSLGDAVFDRAHIRNRNWGLAVDVDASMTSLDASQRVFEVHPEDCVPTLKPDSPFETEVRERTAVLASPREYQTRYSREAGTGFFRKQLTETLRLMRRHGFGGLLTKLRGLRWRHFKLLAYSLRRGKSARRDPRSVR